MALVIFAGLPGVGKSSLAEAVGASLVIPVFNKDQIEAALWRSGIDRSRNSGWASYELLTTLAEGQLRRGQSAILDSVAGLERIRSIWRQLAVDWAAAFAVLECVCSSDALHRSRLQCRQQTIPGWYELSWAEVERARATYEPWLDRRLVLDSAAPMTENVAAAAEYVRAVTSGELLA